jgi:hypothetical protein
MSNKTTKDAVVGQALIEKPNPNSRFSSSGKRESRDKRPCSINDNTKTKMMSTNNYRGLTWFHKSESTKRLGDTDGIAGGHVLKRQAMNLDPEGAINKNHLIKR